MVEIREAVNTEDLKRIFYHLGQMTGGLPNLVEGLALIKLYENITMHYQAHW